MQFVCKDCGCKEVVPDKSLKVCPECGSANTKTFLFGSKSTAGYRLVHKPETWEEFEERYESYEEEEEDLSIQKEAFWSKREMSIGYTCLGSIVGLIGLPAAFIYVIFLLHEQSADIPAMGGEILIIIVLGIIGAAVGALLGYFGSSKKNKRKDKH
jgi:hypothetical protein